MGKRTANAENPATEESSVETEHKFSDAGKEKPAKAPKNEPKAETEQTERKAPEEINNEKIPYGFEGAFSEGGFMPGDASAQQGYGYQQMPYGYMPPPPPPYGYMPPFPPQMPYGQPYGPMPYAYMPPQPPPYGFMPPFPPQGFAPHEGGHGHHHDGQGSEDPFGMLFGKFGDMVKENPNLTALGKFAESTGSDFVKGMLIGAGIAMLFSNDSVKDSLMSIFSKTLGGQDTDTHE